MGLFETFSSFLQAQTKSLVLDLGNFTCGHTRLGTVPDSRDFFAAPLADRDVGKIESLGYSVGTDEGDVQPNENIFALKSEGFEAGSKDGMFDYAFVEVRAFKGSYSHKGVSVILDVATTPDGVEELMGTPYWVDQSDGETIMFYEYAGGTVELQFEFPNQKNLGFITLMRNGILSDAKARKSYFVTAPWPPAGS